ncbi:MAG: UDP-N-acetylmuramate dehydrogenase [Planctomycetes bacterium]|nr:UDP-N-acetylmuramate dehydrogenase [Planctomycetota bacterium]
MTMVASPPFTRFGTSCLRDEPMARHTTYKLGGPARFFLQPGSADELAGMLAEARSLGLAPRFLGGGANVLVRDEGVDAVVAFRRFQRFEVEGEAVLAGAGLNLMALIQRTRERGLAGLETLVGIPGSLGGSVFGNAGGKYGELGDVVEAVTVLDAGGRVRTLTRAEAGFQYRRSRLDGMAVLEARLALARGEPARLKEISQRIHEEKAKSQPLSLPSAGCVFKNPPGDKAGRVIEAAGLKGRRLGGALVSPVHANFITNQGGARARDVLELVEVVQAEVKRRLGVELELEIKVW